MKTPIQVAKIANVTVGTVRNWTRDYAEFLSPSATGAHGTRLFSDEDIEAIRNIAALRKSGVPPSEVTERLRNHDVPPVVDSATGEPTNSPQSSLQQPTENEPTSVDTLQAPAMVQASLQFAHNALQSRVDTVDKRVDDLQRAIALLETRQAAKVNSIVTGIVIGVMVTVIVGALALTFGQ